MLMPVPRLTVGSRVSGSPLRATVSVPPYLLVRALAGSSAIANSATLAMSASAERSHRTRSTARPYASVVLATMSAGAAPAPRPRSVSAVQVLVRIRALVDDARVAGQVRSRDDDHPRRLDARRGALRL